MSIHQYEEGLPQCGDRTRAPVARASPTFTTNGPFPGSDATPRHRHDRGRIRIRGLKKLIAESGSSPVRHDKVDAGGTVTLRHDSKLHDIGIGRAHKGKPIKLLVADRDICVLDARTGELIRRLTLDPSRDYQPIGSR